MPMQKVLTMSEAGQQFEQIVNNDAIKSFETRNQIPVPEFIRNAAVISPSQAYIFAIENLQVPDYEDEYKFLNAQRGLIEIRSNGGTVEIARERINSHRTNLVELAESLGGNTFERNAILASEKVRREKRDEEIFTLEAALVRKYYGIEVTSTSLTDYAKWIAETLNQPENHRAYYSHLLKHYAPISSEFLRSFNPAKEWIDYFDGKYDIGSHCNLERSNSDKLDFYSKYVVDRAFPDFDHKEKTDKTNGLLTHTTSIYRLDEIWKGLRLGGTQMGRVCFSENRITASPTKIEATLKSIEWESDVEVALIFDKKIIRDTYTVLPVTEPGTIHENEFRAYEYVDPRLAIGLIPVSPEFFPSFQGMAFGKMSVGATELEDISVRYNESKILFEKDTLSKFRDRLESMQSKF